MTDIVTLLETADGASVNGPLCRRAAEAIKKLRGELVPYDVLKSLAGEPLLLAASEEQALRQRISACLKAFENWPTEDIEKLGHVGELPKIRALECGPDGELTDEEIYACARIAEPGLPEEVPACLNRGAPLWKAIVTAINYGRTRTSSRS
jgi:hypothetical protein